MTVFFWEISNNFHLESFICGYLLSYFIMLIVHELDLDGEMRRIQCQKK